MWRPEFENVSGALVHETANIVGDVKAGTGSRIDPFVTITGNVRLGERVHIGCNVCIFGADGVDIEDGVSVSAGVKIYTGTDDLSSGKLSNPCWPDRVVKRAPVRIGKNAAIGANAVIMPGVHVGEGAVVGALSLVTKDVPPGMIYAGTPAKLIRERPPLA